MPGVTTTLDFMVKRATPEQVRLVIGGLPVWHGALEGGGLSGPEVRDTHSDKLEAIDLRKMEFLSCLAPEESGGIGGDHKLGRILGLVRTAIPIGVEFGVWLYDHGQALLEYLFDTKEIKRVDFFSPVWRRCSGSDPPVPVVWGLSRTRVPRPWNPGFYPLLFTTWRQINLTAMLPVEALAR